MGVLLQAAQSLGASELWLGSSQRRGAQQRSELNAQWSAAASPKESLRVVLVNGPQDEPEQWMLEDRPAAQV